ncbi:PhaM family polyhydroxyalkanoate granule multifunctional regulatory protein [Bordetella genomosp. 13]|uniref:PhaM family polyhydroxyalkanoate granule multifunctional regulatory protein n=1 Tax=Bordetella genomosp. 13 TaxID=463040 RepID=UPI0011AB2148|nr:PhaM family polyhydroxyalkanoate granule multifunctional regulatory protein [Bordetella genomosp. 13]
MTDSNSNPFILPGMGQSSNLSGNPLLASMEMMKQAWAGLTGPGGLAQSLPMTPPMNVEELERRIADLRAVEGWLRMNLSMLNSTIQGMEVQRATIATLRSFIDSAASMDTGAAPAPGQPSPLEIVLGLKPAPKDEKVGGAGTAPFGAGSPGAAVPGGSSSGSSGPASSGATSAGAASAGAASAAGASSGTASAGAPSPEALDNAARSASQAWWSLLQQQFNNIAQATAASMSGMAPNEDAAPAKGAASRPQAGSSTAPAGAPRAAEPFAARPSAAQATKSANPAKSAAAAKKPAARKTPASKAAARKTAAKPAADKT